jgi:hypothetical protein
MCYLRGTCGTPHIRTYFCTKVMQIILITNFIYQKIYQTELFEPAKIIYD